MLENEVSSLPTINFNQIKMSCTYVCSNDGDYESDSDANDEKVDDGDGNIFSRVFEDEYEYEED